MFTKMIVRLAVGVVASLALVANAGVIRVTESNFNAGAGLITFSEKAGGTVNPTYNPADYGGGGGAPTVTFDGAFDFGGPTLQLDASAPDTFITSDGSNPTSPVLSGTPLFNGDIAILFSTDQYGVGFDAGYFNAIGGTAIQAFDRAGNLLGQVVNEALGIEFLGLVTDDNTASIAGVRLAIVGNEPYGYAIDNLRFGLQQDIDVPAPAGIILFGLGLVALGARRRR